jgi:hypothetical protein
MYATRTSFDAGSLCKHLSVVQGDDWKVWNVAAKYTTEFESEERSNSDGSGDDKSKEAGDKKKKDDPDPMQRPCIVSFDSDHIKRPLEFDSDGNAVRNTMSKPFDPLPQYDDSIGVLRIKKNQLSYDSRTQEEFVFSVNSDFFFGIPAEEGKCFKISASQESEHNKNFWTVTYEFHFKKKQFIQKAKYLGGGAARAELVCFWDYAMLNKGRSYLAFGLEWKADFNNGLPITENLLLDEDSFPVAQGDQPLYLIAKKCPRKAWAGLHLP